MRVTGLDGRDYPWPPPGCLPGPDGDAARSSLHLRVRAALRALYPTDLVLEEVPLPGSGGLRADFYLPARRLLVEADGRHHAVFVAHFHGDRRGFREQVRRDADKGRWAALNGLRLARLRHDGGEAEWRATLL